MPRPPIKDLREKILEAARKEFLEMGYERASLKHISKICGISHMPIYSYFKDKENLFSSLVGNVTESLSDAVNHPIEVAMLVERRLSSSGSLITVLSELSPEVLISL